MALSTITIHSSRPLRTELMRPLLALLLVMQAFMVSPTLAKSRLVEVIITDPFIEMHSGPGRGYPVTYVVGRDETLIAALAKGNSSVPMSEGPMSAMPVKGSPSDADELSP